MMHFSHRFYSLSFCLLLVGCQVGPRLSTSLKPSGLTGDLTVDHAITIEGFSQSPVRSFEIEVLALDDEGLLFLSRNKVFHIAYGEIRTLKLRGVSPKRFTRNLPPERVKEQLVRGSGSRIPLLSRFPQGVTPEVLEALLEAYSQDEVVMLP